MLVLKGWAISIGNLIPRKLNTKKTWQPHRCGLTANFNNLNVLHRVKTKQHTPEYELLSLPIIWLHFWTWVANFSHSVRMCVCSFIVSTYVCPHFPRPSAHVSITACVLPPVQSVEAQALWAELIRERTSAPCTHANSFPPSYPLSKVSLLNQLLHNCCYWLLVWKSGYANGAQQGEWKSTVADPLPSQPINGEGFKFQRKFQRRCWKENSKAN